MVDQKKMVGGSVMELFLIKIITIGNDFSIEKILVRYENRSELEYSLTTPLHQLRLIIPPPPPYVWGVWEV
jgi:hypothetical protein